MLIMASKSGSENLDESKLSGESEESSDESEEPVTPGSRKRRPARLENYMSGKSRKAYRVHEDITQD